MMTGKLLIGGMLAGLLAALLSFGFLKIVGGPHVERAIAFETAMDEAKAKARADEAAAKGQPAPVEQAEPELVSRPVQSGIGLLTGVGVLSVAFGGIFALAFALAYGRIGELDARATSAVLAGLGFVSVYLAPMLKYPPNPPAVGLSETIDLRTSLYFALILISLAATIAAGLLRKALVQNLGGWNATLLAGAAYIAVMVGVSVALPDVNEVPENFPAYLLWAFRISSVGGQAILWATLGLAFGVFAERVVGRTKPSLRAFRA
jgi:predicted cobalt transporter CbtA